MQIGEEWFLLKKKIELIEEKVNKVDGLPM